MAPQYAVDDSDWNEVMFINGYAMYMGYLMIGVRGLSLLIITWTTVVLLGGFVSDLGKKDFWCLTVITLIQTAGVFNFLLKAENISATVHSWCGLLLSVFVTLKRHGVVFFEHKRDGLVVRRRAYIVFYILVAIQVLVFGVILCALGVVYMLGMYISAGVSLWRLIEHDLGDAGGANQRPALEVLYILAVAQGVLFGYKTIYALVTRGEVADAAAEDFRKVDKELIEEYIEETLAGCEKNPSFSSGRNFVTYGVNLMIEAKSNEGFISGIKFLGGAIGVNNYALSGRKVLAKYLLTRSDDSSSAIIRRLLEIVGPRSPYSREIKEHVLRILEIIAPCIRLEQFPRAIECLCSVVDTSEETNNNDELRRDDGSKFKDYERVELLEEYEKNYVECRFSLRGLLYECLPCRRKKLENKEGQENVVWAFDQMLVKAVNIIHKLVADDEYNRWIMHTCVSNTMLHKIAMLPTKLHRKNHYPCRVQVHQKSELQMIEQCWVLAVALTDTSRLPLQPATPVAEGWRRRRSEEIEEEVEEGQGQLPVLRSIKDSIQSTIKCIFDCLDCSATQKRQAIQILLHRSLDMSFIINDSESSKRRLSWILLLILTSLGDSKYWMVPSLTYRNKNWRDYDAIIRRLAGEKLSELLREKHDLPSEETGTELQLLGLALEDLQCAFYDGAQDNSVITHAIIIVEGLLHDCYHHKVVEKFLFSAMQEVVKETLIRFGSKTAEREEEQASDLEKGNVSLDNQDGCIDNRRLRKALVSLCYDFSGSIFFGFKFKQIASKICEEQGKSFGDFERFIRYFGPAVR